MTGIRLIGLLIKFKCYRGPSTVHRGSIPEAQITKTARFQLEFIFRDFPLTYLFVDVTLHSNFQ